MFDEIVTTEPEQDSVYSVSQVAQMVRKLIEGEFPSIWIEGELSNVAKPGSGHMYFTIKDQSAQIRCAMFRSANRQLNFDPKMGDQVLIRGRLSLYEPRGDFQMIVDYMEEAGTGALRKAFEQLKVKLSKEGLFDAQFKQAIPELPKCIGVITSSTGAAVRDILATLYHRFPTIPVIIYPTSVQGEAASGQICQAINKANTRNECDVLILARGGGSLEDLWPFNEEAVARAIFASEIPIVSGVGHEVDVTISDFVADVRAATPTAAAQCVSPDKQAWLQTITHHQNQLIRLISHQLQRLQQQVDYLAKCLIDPRQRLQNTRTQMHHILQRMIQWQNHHLEQLHQQLQLNTQRLNQCNPKIVVEKQRNQLQQTMHQLRAAIKQQLQLQQSQLSTFAASLNAISPLATLDRGYAIIQDQHSKSLIHASKQLQVGQTTFNQLAQGSFIAKVIDIHE